MPRIAQTIRRRPLRGLYLVTGPGLPAAAAEYRMPPAIAPFQYWVQYRNKRAGRAVRQREAAMLSVLCRKRDLGFIVNDDPELAAAVGADGVHLGHDDPPIAEARRMLGAGAIIGASCYDSLERARNAEAQGASYVAFGSVFASGTKPDATRIALDTLADYTRQLSLPVCAIGGITLARLEEVLATGVDLVAVYADIAEAPNPDVMVRKYLKTLNRVR